MCGCRTIRMSPLFYCPIKKFEDMKHNGMFVVMLAEGTYCDIQKGGGATFLFYW
jgi:hypothetical protein